MNNNKPVFKTQWNYKNCPTKIEAKIMTVPGLALTNTQHMRSVKMGLSEKTIKVIYDPENNLPDVRVMDLLDQRTVLKEVQKQVQDIRALRKEYVKEQEEKARLAKEKLEDDRFTQFEKRMKDKQKIDPK